MILVVPPLTVTLMLLLRSQVRHSEAAQIDSAVALAMQCVFAEAGKTFSAAASSSSPSVPGNQSHLRSIIVQQGEIPRLRLFSSHV